LLHNALNERGLALSENSVLLPETSL
jgi:hypothetical protein